MALIAVNPSFSELVLYTYIDTDIIGNSYG